MVESNSKQFEISTSFDLSDQEQQIFQTLLKVIEHCNLKTTLRVAGGWVRDKLIGKKSDDIDLAMDIVDNVGVKEFCEHIKTYMDQTGTKADTLSDEFKYQIHSTSENTGKFSHLGKFKLHGSRLELCTLVHFEMNKETLEVNGGHGDAKQDAYRRDLTINSMFYNINTKTVEDFTEQGINDLQNGIIRSPDDPFVNYYASPTGLLRAVRFALKFDFKIEQNILDIAQDQIIKSRLANAKKIKVGTELEKILTDGFKRHIGLQMLFDMGILDLVIKVPDNFKTLHGNNQLMNQETKLSVDLAKVAHDLHLQLKDVQKDSKHVEFCGKQMYFDEQLDNRELLASEHPRKFMRIIYFCCLVYPFHKYTTQKRGTKQQNNLSQSIMKGSFDRAVDISSVVYKIVSNLEQFLQITEQFSRIKGQISDQQKLILGKFRAQVYPFWNHLCFFSQVIKKQANVELNLEQLSVQFKNLNSLLDENSLYDVCVYSKKMTLLEMCNLIGVKQPNSNYYFLNDEATNFQILNPKATKEDLMSFIQKHAEEFKTKGSFI